MMRGRRNAAVVAGLGPGERELGFGRPLDYAPIPAIRVEAGREDVEVRLRPGAGLALRVVDGAGRPVAGAWVEIRPDGEEIGRDDRETTSPDGSVLFEGLEPAGSFTVTVRPPTGRKDLFPERLRIAGLSPGAREVAFERAWVLEAELRDGAGRPLESVRVYRQAPDGTWEYAGWCNGSGRFRSDPLPPGPVRLRVGSMAPPAGAPPQATVPERADPGEIVLGEGTALRIRIEGWPEGADGIGVLESEAGDGGIARADVGPGGHVLFLGVDPESAFTFFLESGPEGRTAFGDGLVPGADEVRLALVPVRPVTGRVVLPEGCGPTGPGGFPLRVDLDGPAVHLEAMLNHEGRFRFDRPPPGRRRLSIEFPWRDRTWAAEADADAGTDVELVPHRPDLVGSNRSDGRVVHAQHERPPTPRRSLRPRSPGQGARDATKSDHRPGPS